MVGILPDWVMQWFFWFLNDPLKMTYYCPLQKPPTMNRKLDGHCLSD